MQKIRTLGVLFVWTLASCAPVQAVSASHAPDFNLVTVAPNSTATSTPFQPAPPINTSLPLATSLPMDTVIPTDTTIPTNTTTTTSLSLTDTPIPATNVPSPTSAPANTRTQYTFYVSLKYSAHTLHADETIQYTNTTGQTLSNIVLAVEPNLSTNCFNLNSIAQNGQALTNYNLNGQRLTINLSQSLVPNAVTNFALSFDLSLPPNSIDKTYGYPSGYLSNQINLTDWYPFIVPYSNGWVLHDPYPFGEYVVYDSADYDVNLKVDDPNVIVATSAPEGSNGAWKEYRLEGARTFVLSASDQFKVDETAVGPVKIRSYYFSGDENASGAVVWMATQSLGLYEAKFAPYPYQSLSVVETDIPDGQEFDGLVFLSTNFYRQYNGTAKSDLITIGTHEIAHQWWYGSVGSDQAEEPWLNEAMAVYSEELFYEFNYPHYGNWWWNFRVNYFGPTGYIDGTIYDYSTFRSFIDAVYLNAAEFIQDIRTRIGDDAFFAFLKDYATRYARQRVTASDFFSTLRLHTGTNISDIIATYFQNQH